MIFIIPIILGAAALVTGATGIAAGIDGVSNIQRAQKIGEAAQRRYEDARNRFEKTLKETQSKAEDYGQLQFQVKQFTVGRFVTFLERIGQNASQEDMRFLEGLEGASPDQLKEYRAAKLEAEKFATGGLKAAGAAWAAGQGTLALVGLFGTASTGAAISGLSGAAAWNATLAFLGGGSLAAGGGGMALGTMVLGGITVGPALMIGGFVLGGQGQKALTKAKEYESKAHVEIAKLDTSREFLGKVQLRVQELKNLVESLNAKATAALDELEPKPFEIERDAAKVQQVALLVKALAEIMKTPVLDNDGNLNSEAANLKAKYRNI